ncbi:hypothetical protein, partial [Aeromonas caviae]|uniref:hypothetical protein n=1 Tax=Aeromonas caviae TaxID=648 RepID=UPI0029DB08BA
MAWLRGAKRSVATFGAMLLEIAERDLAAGVRETSRNDGEAIRRLYLDPLNLAPGNNWCAAAVT